MKREEEENWYSDFDEEFDEKEEYYEEHYKEEEDNTNPGDDESKVDINEVEVWCCNHDDKPNEEEECDEDLLENREK